jgi:hypothetical protein
MAYVTPKTNWATGNIPVASDLNRIEGNAEANHDAIITETSIRESADTELTNAIDAEEVARIAADNINAGYHSGSTASAIKIESYSSLPTPGEEYRNRILILSTVNTVAGKIYSASNVYICLYARSGTVSGYTWVEIASYSI